MNYEYMPQRTSRIENEPIDIALTEVTSALVGCIIDLHVIRKLLENGELDQRELFQKMEECLSMMQRVMVQQWMAEILPSRLGYKQLEQARPDLTFTLRGTELSKSGDTKPEENPTHDRDEEA